MKIKDYCISENTEIQATKYQPSIVILIKSKVKILMISVYVDNFFLAFNSSKILLWLKNIFKNKYDVKDLAKVQTMIK